MSISRIRFNIPVMLDFVFISLGNVTSCALAAAAVAAGPYKKDQQSAALSIYACKVQGTSSLIAGTTPNPVSMSSFRRTLITAHSLTHPTPS